jgi:hypothetical protein
MAIPKAMYKFNTIPMKTLMTFFPKIGKTIPKFIWNYTKDPK